MNTQQDVSQWAKIYTRNKPALIYLTPKDAVEYIQTAEGITPPIELISRWLSEAKEQTQTNLTKYSE